jgi:ribose 5-phosphate isomerase A
MNRPKTPHRSQLNNHHSEERMDDVLYFASRLTFETAAAYSSFFIPPHTQIAIESKRILEELQAPAMANEQEKEAASRAALQFIQDGQIVGLGTGSTAAYAVRFIGDRVKAGLKIRGIPTSNNTREMATKLGIPLTSFDEVQHIDLTIDGADEFDPNLNLIKGGGGALLYEKVVASASGKLVIVADSSKQVPMLGSFPVPVEVITFALPLVRREIEQLGAAVVIRQKSGKPFVTDEGHHILDCHFGRIPDPPTLSRKLSDIPGIVEHGLFINRASVVLVAHGEKVTELHRSTK